jgi:hypothetical protein
VVLLTGLFNVINILYASRLSGGNMPPTFARVLALKIGLVVLMVALQAVDQFVVRRKRIKGLDILPPEALVLPAPLYQWQRLAQWLDAVILAMAVAVVLLGVSLTR